MRSIPITRFFITVTSIIIFLISFAQPCFADSTTSQGYTSQKDLAPGTMVSLDGNSRQAIVASTASNRQRLLGVVIDPDTSTVSFEGEERNVQVALNNTAHMLVSDINGEVRQGDVLSVSPIAGTGMKAATRGKIIGTAMEDFGAVKQSQRQSVELTEKNGRKKTFHVALITVHINVQEWAPTGVSSNAFLNSMTEIMSNISGKPVSTRQSFTVITIALLALLASSVILYSSVSSSIASIGRNPLAKGIVRRNFLYMLGIVILIISGASISIYLILGG